ncbi:membrane protein [Mycolicibacterium wolinskyi]|uniref:Membrane protein n=1 Tax=Mycolicibacterium wolinskyi TaxID=59750 RepID=A0A132PSU2_9MYCO|nr:gephyrin-like molybdotransferase receptor GlpR [Mycolicibacterium wolinskyi]KWX25418.1 membrane protein [Mycolicibacterium wolinskyi]
MPSIPQSLLWISLVVLWLFVLVPMLISKRDSVRRTSDVALATRVLNSGRNAQRLRRGPAAGHHSDPHWQPAADHLDEDLDGELDEADDEPRRTVVVAAAVAEDPEPDYLDVDIVEEDSGALPVGATVADSEPEPEPEAEPAVEEVAEAEEAEPVAEAQSDQLPLDLDDPEDLIDDSDEHEDRSDPTDDEYEYVDDSSGLEAESETDDRDQRTETPVASLSANRQRRYESKTAAQVSARKYKFRKRVLAVFAVVLMVSAAMAFLVNPTAWWVCGTAATLTVLYLAYLRRQTRIEEQLRRRRAQRMMRSRLGVENTDDHKLDVVPARLRRPGSVVLEIDDEDPIFEHLDYAPFSRGYDLPRASGQ